LGPIGVADKAGIERTALCSRRQAALEVVDHPAFRQMRHLAGLADSPHETARHAGPAKFGLDSLAIATRELRPEFRLHGSSIDHARGGCREPGVRLKVRPSQRATETLILFLLHYAERNTAPIP